MGGSIQGPPASCGDLRQGWRGCCALSGARLVPQAMFAVNTWSIVMTFGALLAADELWPTLQFLQDNPAAIWDNVLISLTSASGQLFIYYTIRRFGPVVFTIMMTTRQMFSMVISAFAFGHALHPPAYVAAVLVFGVLFYRIKRGRRG